MCCHMESFVLLATDVVAVGIYHSNIFKSISFDNRSWTQVRSCGANERNSRSVCEAYRRTRKKCQQLALWPTLGKTYFD